MEALVNGSVLRPVGRTRQTFAVCFCVIFVYTVRLRSGHAVVYDVRCTHDCTFCIVCDLSRLWLKL